MAVALSRNGLSGLRWSRLRQRPAAQFFRSLTVSVPGLATAWWVLLVVRSLLPAALAVATGLLVGRVESGGDLTTPLVLFAVVFVLSQVGPPVHQIVGALTGHRFSSALNDRLMATTLGPDGIGHLERGDLTNDLTTARDFDLGWTAPPMYLNMDFIAQGLVMLLGGIASALVLFGFAWWAPPLLMAAWGSTHWLLRESGVWRDRNTDAVKAARRHTSYAYDLATEPAAAKEVRLFGLAPWLLERFTSHRLRAPPAPVRRHPAPGALRRRGPASIVLAANALLFWVARPARVRRAARPPGRRHLRRGRVRGELDRVRWPELGARRRGRAGGGAPAARARDGGGRRAHRDRHRTRAPGPVRPEIRFRDVTFTYPTGSRPVLDGFDLTVPAGASLAIVGQNGAGKTTLAKLLCRLYDPDSGSIEIDGVDLRDLDLDAWRQQVAAVFQDFVRYELPLRDNVAPAGWRRRARRVRPRSRPARSGWPTSTRRWRKGYPGGVDLSGGQWQRVALARAIAKVRRRRRVVLLDEPTAMLDVRGESEIFRRVLDATSDSDHDPGLPPVLDRPAGRADLRRRARPRDRARQPRRADGPRRSLPHDVRPPGLPLRRGRRARRGGRP